MVPEKPEPVTTSLVGSNVVFTWSEPDDRGSIILHYNLIVQTSLLDFVLDPAYCNTVLTTSCSIPMTMLNDLAGNYALPLAALIKAKVSATNS